MTPEERFAAAKARYEAKFATIVCDTPELAAEHGVSLGGHVIVRQIPVLNVENPQDTLDDILYEAWLRGGGWRDGA